MNMQKKKYDMQKGWQIVRNLNCHWLLNKVKQMNIADHFCHHQLTTVVTQETHAQGHGIHKIEYSSGEKLHLYYSGHYSSHKEKSMAGTGTLLTLFRMGLFEVVHGWGGPKSPLPKICYTYPPMMKFDIVIPYIREIQIVYESCDKPLEFCWHQHFFACNQQILLYQEILI